VIKAAGAGAVRRSIVCCGQNIEVSVDWEVYVVNAPYHEILAARWSMNGNVDFAILCALEIAKGNRIAQDERKRRQWESRKRHSGCSIKCTF
jgi:hypothetical protein